MYRAHKYEYIYNHTVKLHLILHGVGSLNIVYSKLNITKKKKTIVSEKVIEVV